MAKRIQKLIDGLDILEAYSNEVYVENNMLVAGPTIRAKVSKEDQDLLEEMDWIFEENDGWTFFLGYNP